MAFSMMSSYWSYPYMPQPQSQYFVAPLSPIPRPIWNPYSGATHHVITYPNNLVTSHDFGGLEKLLVSGGISLPISHIDSNSFHSHTDN